MLLFDGRSRESSEERQTHVPPLINGHGFTKSHSGQNWQEDSLLVITNVR